MRSFCDAVETTISIHTRYRETPAGYAIAVSCGMARNGDVHDNPAWRLAHELNLRVDVFLGCPEFRQQFDCCDQLRAAARSAPLQIAEGYARQRSADSAGFVQRARLSEEQVLGFLIAARRQHLISADELDINRWLTKRAMKAALALLPE